MGEKVETRAVRRDVWQQLRDKVGQETSGRFRLWAWLKEQTNPTLFRPHVLNTVTIRRLEGREGKYYILKNPRAGTYLRLTDREFFLWGLMDGTRSVRELMVAYLHKYRALAFGLITSLVDGLKQNQFLVQRPVDVFGQVRGELEKRRPTQWGERALHSFFQHEFAIGGLDKAITVLYRAGFRFLFARPVLILLALLALAGLAAFALSFQAGTYTLLKTGDSYLLGMVALLVSNLLTIFTHESAHALTTKHFGREVRRGGFMIYWGLPAFFVDTTDIWLESKARRIAVSLAGPCADLVVGGVCSLAVFIFPAWPLSSLLFKVAFMAYLGALVNLNPLLELDGYFVLVDWLEMPMLRRHSLEFVRHGLWDRLRRREQLSRDERIFAVFGLLAMAYAVVAVWLAASFWRRQVARLLGEIWARGGWWLRAALGVGIVLVVGPLAVGVAAHTYRLARRFGRWLAGRGLLDRSGLMAALAVAAVGGLVMVAALLPGPWVAVYLALLPALLLLWALLCLAGTAVYYAGSGFRFVFFSLATALLVSLLAQAATAAGWAVGLGRLAFLPLLLAAFLAFAQNGLERATAVEKGLMAGLLGAAFAVVVPVVLWAVDAHLSTGPWALLPVAAAPYFGVLSLALLVPTVAAFADTRFGMSWVFVWLATLGMVAGEMMRGYAAAHGEVRVAVETALRIWPSLVAGGWLVAFALYLLAHLRTAYRRAGWPLAEVLSDEERLRNAFAHFFEPLFAQFRHVYGHRQAQAVDDRLDVVAVTAGWGVAIDRGRVRDSLPFDRMAIAEVADRYREVLSYTVDLMDNLAGRSFLQRAVQNAYDGLPWEEREVLGRYVLAGTPWGAALSRDFEASRDDCRRLLQVMPLFADATDEDIARLASALHVLRLPAGRRFVRQGQPGRRFYLIRYGKVEVWQRDETGHERLVEELRRGDYFGEYALLRGEPYRASYRTAVDGELLAMYKADFDRLVRDRLALKGRVEQAAGIVALLGRMPLFAELSRMELKRLAARFAPRRVGAGRAIITQGQPGRAFFVVATGSVTVIVEQGTAQERVVAHLGQGEYFGEIGLLLDVPASASVVAGPQGAVVLALARRDFEAFIGQHRAVVRRLEQVGSGRRMDTRRKLGLSGAI